MAQIQGIIGVFFIGLNKSSIYDTKNLVGQKITNIKLERFNNNRIITEEDLPVYEKKIKSA